MNGHNLADIYNPTEWLIETTAVRNGLWPGWTYLCTPLSEDEEKRIVAHGAIVTREPATTVTTTCA